MAYDPTLGYDPDLVSSGPNANTGPTAGGGHMVQNGDGTFSWINGSGQNEYGGTPNSSITNDPTATDAFLTQFLPYAAAMVGGPMAASALVGGGADAADASFAGLDAGGQDAGDAAFAADMGGDTGAEVPGSFGIGGGAGGGIGGGAGGGLGGLFSGPGTGPALINTAGSFLKNLFSPQRQGFTGNVNPQTLLNNDVSAGTQFGNAMAQRAETPITTPGSSINTPSIQIPGLNVPIGGQASTIAPKIGQGLNMGTNPFGIPPPLIPPNPNGNG